jgi:hypothetical protein
MQNPRRKHQSRQPSAALVARGNIQWENLHTTAAATCAPRTSDMAITVINGPTIAAGASLSNVLDVPAASSLKKIAFPDAWSTDPTLMLHSISFQWSPDNVTFFDLFDIRGAEILIKVVPGGMAVLERDIWYSGFLKFRAGPSRQPVPQAQVRNFKCYLE